MLYLYGKCLKPVTIQYMQLLKFNRTIIMSPNQHVNEPVLRGSDILLNQLLSRAVSINIIPIDG